MPYKDPEKRKANAKQYLARPEVKARVEQYRLDNLEQTRIKHREYESRPEVKARRAEYWRKHQASGKKYPSQDPVFVSKFNKEYRKTHMEEHNEQGRNGYHRLKKNKEWLIKRNQRTLEWKNNNPTRWRQAVLKSQVKYLKRLESEINIKYHKIPYLYKQWADLIKIQCSNKCQICYKKADHTHHIFHKAKYPKLSLNLNNGIPLCMIHHNEVHGKGLK